MAGFLQCDYTCPRCNFRAITYEPSSARGTKVLGRCAKCRAMLSIPVEDGAVRATLATAK